MCKMQTVSSTVQHCLFSTSWTDLSSLFPLYSGCTPVAVAAQHNHSLCVVFLQKNGADLLLCDKNGDNPLHWAAYKGHTELVGFLSYRMKHSLENVDNFGQTALHLAALRGNYEVVEYLVLDCHADVSKKDRNGQTPLDLSISKEKLKIELFLKRVVNPNFVNFVRSFEPRRLLNGRVFGMVFLGANDKEISNWPWRIVFTSNLIGSILTVYFLMNENLSDLYALHLLNTMLQCLWWVFFILCLITSPGIVRDINDEYEKSLDLIRTLVDEKSAPSICHSCRVRRPLRSKHCKIQRRCIDKFDHFCPFVGNTVGRDNYRYFVGLLVMHTICGTLWEITALYLALRVTISWCFLFYMLYALMWMFMIFGLLSYHTQLILSNMTTNEHINHMKYSYMTNAFGGTDSPFSKPTIVENLLDGLFPSTKNYYSRQEVKADEVAIRGFDIMGHDHEHCSHGHR